MLARAGEGKRWRIWEQSRQFLLPAPGASVLRSSLGEGNGPSCSRPRTPAAQRGAPHPGGGDGFQLEVVEGQLGFNPTGRCGELDESGKSVDQSQGVWAGGAEGSAGLPGVSSVPRPVAARGPPGPAQPRSPASLQPVLHPKVRVAAPLPPLPPQPRASHSSAHSAHSCRAPLQTPAPGVGTASTRSGPAAVAAAGRLGAPRGPAAAGRALPPRLPNPGTGKAAEFGRHPRPAWFRAALEEDQWDTCGWWSPRAGHSKVAWLKF